LGDRASAEAVQTLRAQAGLDDPVPVQFFRFVGRALHGDFGYSYRSGLPVFTLLSQRLPATLELVFCACLITALVAVPLGIYSAVRHGRWGDGLVQAASLAGASMPTFLTGLLLIFVFAVQLPIFPAAGRGTVHEWGWWSTGLAAPSGLLALALPSLTLASYQTALFVRLIRAELLEVLASDFIAFARARGLSSSSILFRHALRNALLPVLTVAGTQLGMLVAFSIATETVFQWPGVGALFIHAVREADLPVFSAYLLFTALLFVSINLAVDLLYLAVDPRLRRPASYHSGSAE
jgi:peptide/nickel transport system permease protein